MYDVAGFSHQQTSRWRLKMVFDEWVARMRTPPERVIAIRSVLDTVPEEARLHFAVENDHSFFIEAAFFEARKNRAIERDHG
jgi:hypothetical protein